jgi:hypothetical protein
MRNFVSYATGLAVIAACAANDGGRAAGAVPLDAATIAAVASATMESAAPEHGGVIAVRHRSHAPSPVVEGARPTYVAPNYSSSGSPYGSPFGSPFGGAPGYSRYGSYSGGYRSYSQPSGAHQYQFPK